MFTFISQYFKIYSKSIILFIYFTLLSLAIVTAYKLEINEKIVNDIAVAVITISGIIVGFVFNSFIQLGNSNQKAYETLLSHRYNTKITNLLFYKLTFTFVLCVVTICISLAIFLISSKLVFISIGFMLIQFISLFHVLSDFVFILRD